MWPLAEVRGVRDHEHMAGTAIDEHVVTEELVREINRAMRLRCEMPSCLSGRHDPATWRIEVRHGPISCDVEEMLICSRCRNGLYRDRKQPISCPLHGELGYPLAQWWRPIGVLP